jgi:hypothetical protein
MSREEYDKLHCVLQDEYKAHCFGFKILKELKSKFKDQYPKLLELQDKALGIRTDGYSNYGIMYLQLLNKLTFPHDNRREI